MATLLLKLIGPMQSWGSRSRFDWRDTEREPTKSGVLGLCAAALSRKRKDSIADLATLRLGVRVDREGHLRREFQTAKKVIRASTPREKWLKARAKGKTVGTQDTVVSHRFYLTDAAFLVGLEGPREILKKSKPPCGPPAFTLYLGRRGYLPAEPVFFHEGGLMETGLEEALAKAPPVADPPAGSPALRSGGPAGFFRKGPGAHA